MDTREVNFFFFFFLNVLSSFHWGGGFCFGNALTAISSSIRYLQELEAFLESKASELFDGKRTLQLHPRGLELVNNKLASLDKLNDLNKSEQPLDYIRAYVSDINDHQRLERIQNIILRLPKVKLMSLSKMKRDPTPIDLTHFRFLTSLEVYKCDLSTHPALGIAELRPRLQTLVVSNSAEALGHIFAPRGSESELSDDVPREWQKLTTVKCSHNSCSRMDSSLTLLTCVRSLDLSANCFKAMENLHNCVNMMSLDLSYNRISSTARLNERCGNLTQLKLRCNSLTSTEGIDKLYSLEHLDLSGNLISTFKEISRLSALPCLEVLFLKENPIGFASNYRVEVLSRLVGLVSLDGAEATTKELAARRGQQATAGGLNKGEEEYLYAPKLEKRRKSKLRNVDIVPPTFDRYALPESNSSFGKEEVDLPQMDTIREKDPNISRSSSSSSFGVFSDSE